MFGFAALGTAAGPFVGGVLTQQLSWRWVFLAVTACALLALPLVAWSVRDTRDETVPPRLDVTGIATVSLGIAGVTFAFDRGPTWGWGSASFVAALAAGVALLAGFVVVERRVRWPLVDLRLFRNARYVTITLAGTCANAAAVVTVFGSTL